MSEHCFLLKHIFRCKSVIFGRHGSDIIPNGIEFFVDAII